MDHASHPSTNAIRNQSVLSGGSGCKGLEIEDAIAPLTETLPCNLKARLIESFGKQPAGQKDYAEQGMDDVIGLPKMERADYPHPIRRRP